jgi:hypothetical protein
VLFNGVPYSAGSLSVNSLVNTSSVNAAANGLVVTGPASGGVQVFPAVAMAAVTSPEGFTATSSSVAGASNTAVQAFDKNATSSWYSYSNSYNGSGVYVGSTSTNVSGANIIGEWVQLQTPVPYKLVNYSVNDADVRQKQWVLAGSQDGSTWYFIDSQNLSTVLNSVVTYTPPSVSTPFIYYRYIVQACTGGQSTSVRELSFNGVPYSTGSLTVTGSRFAVTTPGYWKYNLSTTTNIAANTTVTPPSTAWTLSNPTGSATIMNAAGTLTIPATGVYNVTLNAYYNPGGGPLASNMGTSDTALGNLYYVYGNQSDQNQSWTGRLPAGVVLTPGFYSSPASSLPTSGSNLNAITITQLFLCN